MVNIFNVTKEEADAMFAAGLARHNERLLRDYGSKMATMSPEAKRRKIDSLNDEIAEREEFKEALKLSLKAGS
jgi:hypothetical protein